MRKKEFTTANGSEGMTIDCDTYEVEIFKSKEEGYYSATLKFTHKETGNAKHVSAAFYIKWDKDSDGGRLELEYKDRWGSKMTFVHYEPSDLKGMFDFIGKGYNIFDENFTTKTFLFREQRFKVGEKVKVSKHYAGYKNQYPFMVGVVWLQEDGKPMVTIEVNPDDVEQGKEQQLEVWTVVEKFTENKQI
jgi:hypothetical protein